MNAANVDEGAPLSEREKWERETDYKERELHLREREYELKARETELKENEQRRSGWKSPLVVAIMAASVAAFGNAVVALTVGLMQRQLEEEKAEQQRILEMIKTDTEKAAENLAFLINVGLVTNKIQREKLADFLENRQPGEGPSLPVEVGMRESRSLTYHPVDVQMGQRAVRVRFRETNHNPRSFPGNHGDFTVNGKTVQYADEGIFEMALSLSAEPQELKLKGSSLVGDYVEVVITEYDFAQEQVGEKIFKVPVKNGTITLVHRTQKLDIDKILKDTRPRPTSKAGK